MIMSPTACECSEDEGPCEAHVEILAQREGASARTADALCEVFILDALDIDPQVLSPYGREVFTEVQAALADATWIEDPDLADALRDLCNQVESHLADLYVRWDDGYTIARIIGGPLKEES